MTILGTSGDDNLNGTSGDDKFKLMQGGNDTANGIGGNDTFNFGTTFSDLDHIDGGSGIDTLKLNGNTSLIFGASTMVNVEKILLASGHDYNFHLDDATIAAGKSLSVNASALGAGNTLILYATAETDGNLKVTGGAGGDIIEGGLHHTIINAGDGNDSVYLNGGVNIVNGGLGDDIFNVTAPISTSSRFDGGAGGNQIFFNGDFSAGQTIGAHWGTNIGDMAFSGAHNYKIVLQDGLVAAGHTLGLYGNGIVAGNTLSINASHLTSGNVQLQGGQGNDTLIGGAGNDGFEGRQGKDVMTGGAGVDTFYFNGVADSTGPIYDRITDFDAANEHIHLHSLVVANIDAAVSGGGLSTSNIDSKLPTEIGASQLLAGDAVLFTPSSGTLAGHVMLIVDANGVAGYQAGADYVIDVTGMTGTLSASNFTS